MELENTIYEPSLPLALLAILSRLDQLTTEAEAILAGPGDVEIGVWAEELREHLVEMRAKVEAKLDG